MPEPIIIRAEITHAGNTHALGFVASTDERANRANLDRLLFSARHTIAHLTGKPA